MANASKLDPAPPAKRDEVQSRTPLRVRERIAWLRYWWHVYPARRGAILMAIAFPIVEHYEHTFPAIKNVVKVFLALWVPTS